MRHVIHILNYHLPLCNRSFCYFHVLLLPRSSYHVLMCDANYHDERFPFPFFTIEFLRFICFPLLFINVLKTNFLLDWFSWDEIFSFKHSLLLSFVSLFLLCFMCSIKVFSLKSSLQLPYSLLSLRSVSLEIFSLASSLLLSLLSLTLLFHFF